MDRFSRNTLTLASVIMVIGIGLGAFGAHGLEDKVSEENLQTFATGVLYHLLHGIAIALMAGIRVFVKDLRLRWVVHCFSLGILFFSGSIYLLATSTWTNIPTAIIGPITPIGGILFIVGWSLLAWRCINYQSDEHVIPSAQG